MSTQTPAEQQRAIQQVQYIVNALHSAKENDGTWLNKKGMMPPRIYPAGQTVSPFNALILQLDTDKNDYSTSQYTFYNNAKSANAPVKAKEKGVPFNWYAWNNYVNKHNPEDKLTAAEYKELSPEQQQEYKGVKERVIKSIFNIDQTALSKVDSDKYNDLVQKVGSLNDRGNLKAEERQIRTTVNAFMAQMKKNLLPIRREGSASAHFESDRDAVYIPTQNKYQSYPEFVQDLMRQVVTATGHQQRLAREGMTMKGGKPVGPAEERYEKLVVEVASGLKMSELGMPAKISPANKDLINLWAVDLQESPTMLEALETDVNMAMEVIKKAEKGEKIRYANIKNEEKTTEFKQKQSGPQVDSREAAILCDILRFSGMKIDSKNFESPKEKKAFLDKFNLAYYENHLNGCYDMISEEENPEAIEYLYGEALKTAAKVQQSCAEYLPEKWNNQTDHYLIMDYLSKIPNEKNKNMVVIKDPKTNIYDVIIPGGIKSGGYVETPSGYRREYRITPDEVMTKAERAEIGAKLTNSNLKGYPLSRIESALKKDGAEYVRFFSKDGKTAYGADDAFYAGKTVQEIRNNGGKLELVAPIDVSKAVAESNSVLFDHVAMLKDNEGRYVMGIKPLNGDEFHIYPEKEDINRFFTIAKQRQPMQMAAIKRELGRKYFEMAKADPSLKFDLFNQIPEGVDTSRIKQPNIFKSKEGKYLCIAKLDGNEKNSVREVTRDQWQRMFEVSDREKYKMAIAANVFADKLLGKDKVQQQTPSNSQQPAHKQGEGQTAQQNPSVAPEIGDKILDKNLSYLNEIKDQYPNRVVLFENGAGFTAFREDAEVLSRHGGDTVQRATIEFQGEKIESASIARDKMSQIMENVMASGQSIAFVDTASMPEKSIIQNQQAEQIEQSSSREQQQDEENRQSIRR